MIYQQYQTLFQLHHQIQYYQTNLLLEKDFLINLAIKKL